MLTCFLENHKTLATQKGKLHKLLSPEPGGSGNAKAVHLCSQIRTQIGEGEGPGELQQGSAPLRRLFLQTSGKAVPGLWAEAAPTIPPHTRTHVGAGSTPMNAGASAAPGFRPTSLSHLWLSQVQRPWALMGCAGFPMGPSGGSSEEETCSQ